MSTSHSDPTTSRQPQVVSASSPDPKSFTVDWTVSPWGKSEDIACTNAMAVSSFIGVLDIAVSDWNGVLDIVVSVATGVLSIAVSDATGVLATAVSGATGVLAIAVSEATGVLKIAVSGATGVLAIAVSDATSVAEAAATGALTAQLRTNGWSIFPVLSVPSGRLLVLLILRLPKALQLRTSWTQGVSQAYPSRSADHSKVEYANGQIEKRSDGLAEYEVQEITSAADCQPDNLQSNVVRRSGGIFLNVFSILMTVHGNAQNGQLDLGQRTRTMTA